MTGPTGNTGPTGPTGNTGPTGYGSSSNWSLYPALQNVNYSNFSDTNWAGGSNSNTITIATSLNSMGVYDTATAGNGGIYVNSTNNVVSLQSGIAGAGAIGIQIQSFSGATNVYSGGGNVPGDFGEGIVLVDSLGTGIRMEVTQGGPLIIQNNSAWNGGDTQITNPYSTIQIRASNQSTDGTASVNILGAMNSNATYGYNGGVFLAAGNSMDAPTDSTYMLSLGANVPYEITGALIRVPGVQMIFNDGAVTGGGFSLFLGDTGSGLNNQMNITSAIPAGLGDTSITNVYNSVTVQAGNSARLFGDFISIGSGNGTTGIGTVIIYSAIGSYISMGDPRDFDGTGTLLIKDPAGTITISNSSDNAVVDSSGFGVNVISDNNSINISAITNSESISNTAGSNFKVTCGGESGGLLYLHEVRADFAKGSGIYIQSEANDIVMTTPSRITVDSAGNLMLLDGVAGTAKLQSDSNTTLFGAGSINIKAVSNDITLTLGDAYNAPGAVVIFNGYNSISGRLTVDSTGALYWNSHKLADA
jgi:hypothetical protein